MRRLAEDLWVTERPLRFLGLEVGARMTVVRLRDGGLLLHSPVAPDPELRAEIEALGEPRHAVAPNRFHHLFIAQWRGLYPALRLYAAPGLPAKRADVAFDAVLEPGFVAPWADDLDHQWVAGMPTLSEVVFLHRASRTLIVCDLAFNLGREAPLATRVGFSLLGGYGKLGPSLVERVLVRDRAAARAALARVLDWDFDRVIVAHGSVMESGGRAALARGYRWLVGG